MTLLLVVVCLAASGCVRRRMTVRSNPPGAMVYIDDQQIGTTPVSTGFTYYGTRKLRLVRDGYETLTVKHTFERPWYQVTPIDFVSENLTVREIRDERILDFTLVPQQMIPSEQLWRNAENLRQSAGQGFIAPRPQLPAAGPPILLPETVPTPAPTGGTSPGGPLFQSGNARRPSLWR